MRILAHLFCIIFLMIVLAAVPGVPACATNNYDEDNKAFLLLVDRISLEDLLTYAGPVLNDLMDEGGLAVLNTRAGRLGSESGYLSMGTGTRAAADHLAGLSFTIDEQFEGHPAEQIYIRYMGEAPSGEVFNISIPLIQRKNEALEYKVIPGLLGGSLAQEGIEIAVFGNADTDVRKRAASLIAMDQNGTVVYGDVSDGLLINDPLFPYGRRLDGNALAETVSDYLGDVSLVVVDWGDFTRIDESSDKFVPEQRQELMKQSFMELDLFLGSFSHMIGPSNLFILAVPSPSRQLLTSGRQLTPLLITGGSFGSGLLASPTTRRPGLVANLDMPSTILEHLQVRERPPHMGGTPIYTVSHDQPAEFLMALTDRAARIYEQRALLVRGYLTFLTLVLLAGAFSLAFELFLRFRKIIILLLEFSMIFPLTLLLLAIFQQFPPVSFVGTVLTVIVVSIAIIGFLCLLKLLPQGRYVFWAAIGLSTSILIFADLFMGSSLQMISFMGYDPVAGARYFGMGNEYMGTAIGATVLGTTGLLEAWKCHSEKLNKETSSVISWLIPIIILYYLTAIFLMASPNYGANVGGTLAAIIAFGIAAAGIIRVATGYNFRPVYFVGVFSLMVLSLWLFYQYVASAEHWHLQSFLNQLMTGDFEGVESVIKRKLNMNFRLLRYSIWSYVLVAFLGLLVLLFFYPVGRMKKLKEERMYLFTGIMAIVAGSVAALLLNDSGVVAAATTLLFGVPPLLIYYLGVNKDEGKRKGEHYK